MQIAPAGDRALLLTLPDASAARLRAIAVGARQLPGTLAAIIGYESVYVVGSSDADALTRAATSARETTDSAVQTHRIDVSFASQYALDLESLLQRASRPQLLDRISNLTLTARYLGFHSGYAYLEGWPADLALPRRPTSRNLVPGGSFAVAGVMAGFYPVDSPGGWNVLGRTDSLPRIRPGDEIRIVPVDRELHFVRPPVREAAGEVVADVIAPGQLTTVAGARDWRRAEDGDTPGGRFDEDAAAAANRAVGNSAEAPLLECVLVGPKLRFRDARRVAWCGPSCVPRLWRAAAGEEVDIGRIGDGFRGYLAIEGGVVTMNNRLLSGAPPPSAAKGRDSAAERGGEKLKPIDRTDRLAIRIMRGPHDAPPFPERWEVTPNINRVGIRLRSMTNVDVRLPADLPSCGMQFGTIQWHPDGTIVVMGPDHPVTGGYLQPATVVSSELWKLGQLAPGEQVRLVAV